MFIWSYQLSSIVVNNLMPKYTRTYLIGCDMNFSDASGILSSPLHPNPYPSGKDCAYIISQPNGTYINFTVVTMDIDCQEMLGSEVDYLEFRDGIFESSPLMGRSCGNGSNFPATMQTTQHHLRIRLYRTLKIPSKNFRMCNISSQIQVTLLWERHWIPAPLWVHWCRSNDDIQNRNMWCAVHNHKWNSDLTVIPREIPRLWGLFLHHLAA